MKHDGAARSAQWGISPAAKIEYRWDEGHGFDIETGGTWSHETQPADEDRKASYFLMLGYRARF